MLSFATIMAVALGVFTPVQPPIPDAADLAQSDLLAKLRAKDNLLNNAAIRVRHRDRQFESLMPYYDGQVDSRTFPIDHFYIKSFIYRGADSTTISEPQDPTSPIRSQIWQLSNSGWRDIAFMKDSESKLNANLASSSPRTPFHENECLRQRREMQWSLGFGYGGMIKSIDSIEKVASGYSVTATWRVSAKDAVAKILIDETLVVRRFEVESPINDRQAMRGVIRTEGFARIGDADIAAKGTDTTIEVTFSNTGRTGVQTERVIAEQEFQFIECKQNLDDAEHERLVKLAIPPNTYVWDHGNQIKQYLNTKGEVEETSKFGAYAAKPIDDQSLWTWVIIAHGIIFSAIAGIAYFGYRRKKLRQAG